MATPVVSLPVPDVVGIAIKGFRGTVNSFAENGNDCCSQRYDS